MTGSHTIKWEITKLFVLKTIALVVRKPNKIVPHVSEEFERLGLFTGCFMVTFP